MSVERAQLLANIPSYPRHWELPVAALTVTYAGGGTPYVTVDDVAWRVRGDDGAESFTIPLDDGVTLEGFLVALRQHTGYDGDTLQGYADVRAAALVEESERALGPTATTFHVGTNPLWLLATTLARNLARAAARIDIGLTQLNLLTAATSFADYWGTFVGALRRPPRHADVTGGTVTVTAGSPFVFANTPGTVAWQIALGAFAPEDAFQGAHLAIGDVAVPIVSYFSKGAATHLPGGSDFAKLILEHAWPGPTQTTAAYQIVFVPESDEAYTARMLYELLRPRENNIALSLAIQGDAGVNIEEVRDLERDIFVLGGDAGEPGTTLEGYFLAGGRYNAATAEVRIDGFPTVAAIASARANAAGGVRLFVLGRLPFNALSRSTLTLRARRLIIGAVPAMQIGVGAIGQTKIGPP